MTFTRSERCEHRMTGVRLRMQAALGLSGADPRSGEDLADELARARHRERLLLRVAVAAQAAHDAWAGLGELGEHEAMELLRLELLTAGELTA